MAIGIGDGAIGGGDDDITAPDVGKGEGAGDVGARSGQQHAELHIAGIDADRDGEVDLRPVGARRDIGALDIALCRQRDHTDEAASGDIDAAGERPGRRLDDGTMAGEAGEVELGKVDGQRAGSGADDAIGRYRPIVGLALRLEDPAFGLGRDARGDLGKADA